MKLYKTKVVRYARDLTNIKNITLYALFYAVASFFPNNSPAVAGISSSTIITNNENNMQINMGIGNEKSLLVQNSPTESVFFMQNDDIVPIPSFEVLIDSMSCSTASALPIFPNAAKDVTSFEEPYPNKKPHPTTGAVPFLSTTSTNNFSPGKSSLVNVIVSDMQSKDLFLRFDRLTNIENAINNLIGYVNSLGEDIASIDAQLKCLSKNIKTIQSYIAPNTTTNVPIVSASLQNSSSNASSSTTSAKKMFKDKNLMELKHDLTSIRSFLRKMIVAVYSRNEILADKHLNDNDDRYITITEGLKDGFGLSEAALNALYGSLRETRHQLTKDVRYMKVMKPKFTRISTDNVATEPNVQDNEKITEATATGR
ncbi:unnamed protein product [Rotaria sordida]|uniref:Uncharacterized protein n=1 Tax=Rotaria sordida TaxID=392033 RepID=A0A819MJU6_9BILA|nr:unnamed protein product [Rotaria sordida]